MDMYALKYPIGEYQSNKNPDAELLENWIHEIEAFPAKLESEVEGISIETLSRRYRPEGWTIKQVVHHCVDSHVNGMIRFKLALTEENVTIRPYFEDRWARLADSLEEDIEPSLLILRGLHKKLGILMRSITAEQLKLELIHPEYGYTYTLAEYIGNYAWHCNHHLAHIKQAKAGGGTYN
jgi:hypothetical protein